MYVQQIVIIAGMRTTPLDYVQYTKGMDLHAYPILLS